MCKLDLDIWKNKFVIAKYFIQSINVMEINFFCSSRHFTNIIFICNLYRLYILCSPFNLRFLSVGITFMKGLELYGLSVCFYVQVKVEFFDETYI